jgi:hypothetical protein
MGCTRKKARLLFSSVSSACGYNEEVTCHFLYITDKQLILLTVEFPCTLWNSAPLMAHKCKKPFEIRGTATIGRRISEKVKREKSSYKIVGRVSVRNVNMGKTNYSTEQQQSLAVTERKLCCYPSTAV